MMSDVRIKYGSEKCENKILHLYTALVWSVSTSGTFGYYHASLAVKSNHALSYLRLLDSGWPKSYSVVDGHGAHWSETVGEQMATRNKLFIVVSEFWAWPAVCMALFLFTSLKKKVCGFKNFVLGHAAHQTCCGFIPTLATTPHSWLSPFFFLEIKKVIFYFFKFSLQLICVHFKHEHAGMCSGTFSVVTGQKSWDRLEMSQFGIKFVVWLFFYKDFVIKCIYLMIQFFRKKKLF